LGKKGEEEKEEEEEEEDYRHTIQDCVRWELSADAASTSTVPSSQTQ
jgi:hypothetical protein